MGAPDLVGLDDLVCACRAQAKRPLAMTELVWVLSVDHRPLVQAEAPQVGRASCGRGQEPPDESHRGRPAGQEGRPIKPGSAIFTPVEPPAFALAGTLQGEPHPWVPAVQLCRAEHVVRKKEVLDRMVPAGARACVRSVPRYR